MKIILDSGVLIDDLEQIMFRAIFAAAQVFNKRNIPLTITSTTSGRHMEGSLHYHGLAIDLRVWRIPHAIRQRVINELRHSLNLISHHFQVILEEIHIHIEYDDGVQKYETPKITQTQISEHV